ncbi:MAG: sortase [Cryobacterium sp.]|uniref:DUF3592 domain-containing protein n=1 Tax=unclassified Cryobacterium TaxID=2649013 RepID=UPI0018C9DC2C|nr:MULTISPECIES: DUF3592 domain-containing protein [unclassified Cryobacterium]MCY7404637.1 sortase [Cryobacterium sp.]MEC5153839.1 hypothetical protein [Cryobacterium sp. CAN_C3]
MRGTVDLHSFVGILSEILTLVGLIIGGILFVIGLAVRGISGHWVKTDAVIAASATGTVIRWFDDLGDVHECPAATQETHQLAPGSDVVLWFRRRTPDRCRTHDPDLDGKGLRLTGLVLLGLGVVAGIIGIALMFL